MSHNRCTKSIGKAFSSRKVSGLICSSLEHNLLWSLTGWLFSKQGCNRS